MATPQTVVRSWFVDLGSPDIRLRCFYERHGQLIQRFTVQLELCRRDDWRPVVRYDNTHGFCHRDTLHADGTQEKTRLFVGDNNATFTFAIDDLRANWQAYCDRYLKEMGS